MTRAEMEMKVAEIVFTALHSPPWSVKIEETTVRDLMALMAAGKCFPWCGTTSDDDPTECCRYMCPEKTNDPR